VGIENRIEAVRREPDYAGEVFDEERQERGAHRAFVGGGWDQHGQRQLDYLVSQGLRPEHRLLDVGAGAFRAGRHLIDYLESGHYYGIDINKSLLEVGYERELSDEQRAKLPMGNVHATDRFDADFGDVRFDMAIAQSVFSHISLNNARVCLHRVAKVMKPGARFFVTFFEGPEGTPIDAMLPKPRRFHERNPYWYTRSDMVWVAKNEPWRVRYIGDWGHPAGQQMLEFTRLTDQEFAAKLARRANKSQAADHQAAKPTSTAGPTGPVAAAKSLARRVRRRLHR
jgi:SAM-dependent methyltransferase